MIRARLKNIFNQFSLKSNSEPPRRPIEKADIPKAKLGLALSAGGARGLAHVGVLQVLEEEGIEVHAIAGASMGSYVGALWAAGFSGEKLEELAGEMHNRKMLWRLADPVFPPLDGLFRGEKAKNHLKDSIGELTFEELERQLLIISADLDSKERIVFRNGPIAEAVHASCAMPGVVTPVLHQGRRCTDGGVADPVPVGTLHKFSDVDVVLAVSVIPTFYDVDAGRCTHHEENIEKLPFIKRSLSRLNQWTNILAPGNSIDTLRQAIKAAQIRIASDACKRADLAIYPDVLGGAWHDYSNFPKYIEAGRQAARLNIDELKLLLNQAMKTDESPKKYLVGERVA